MSLSYCTECGVIVEGQTIFCRGCDSDICLYCGNPTNEIPEEDPNEER